MKKELSEEIEIPDGIEVEIDENIKIKRKEYAITKKLKYPGIEIKKTDNKISILAKKATKREKRIIGTFKAHIKNMICGVIQPYVYEMKICSGHFPMGVTLQNNVFFVKNFLGEKIPRTIEINKGVTVKIDGIKITVESPNKELAGQTAASIEQLCSIANRDNRIFQDGIYIINKSGKKQ